MGDEKFGSFTTTGGSELNCWFVYRLIHGEGRSAGFELVLPSTNEVLFTMDMDVNRPIQQTRLYEIAGLRFRGISPSQILADKIAAISTNKVFRRIKDVVDLYYLSKVFPFERDDLMQTLHDSGRHLENFDGFLHRSDDLKHAYEKFRVTGDVRKPDFDEVYVTVKAYIKPILPKERRREMER